MNEKIGQVEQYTVAWSNRHGQSGRWPDLIEWFAFKAPDPAFDSGVISMILDLATTTSAIDDAVKEGGGWENMAWDQFVRGVAKGAFRGEGRTYPATVMTRMSLLRGRDKGPAQIAPDTDPNILEFYQLLVGDGIVVATGDPISELEISQSVYDVFGPALMGIFQQSLDEEEMVARLRHLKQHGPLSSV